MSLNIHTFVNQKGCSFFKALGHPQVRTKLNDLADRLKSLNNWAVYDPQGFAEDFFALSQIQAPEIFYVQSYEAKLSTPCGKNPRLITDIKTDQPKVLFIPSFEANKYLNQMSHILPQGCEIITLDDLKLPEEMLSNPHNYLEDTNWATNFCYFREKDGWHTRLGTANYWNKYGADKVHIECTLFDESGEEIAHWVEELKPLQHSIFIDSQDIKKRFNLPDFMGQIFLHVVGAKGHSVVKYALDTYHDNGQISATHDANAWPPEYFAGLPAPRDNEQVILWLQNSHPVHIHQGDVALNIMGSDESMPLPMGIAPFATIAIDVGEHFPNVKWPQQLELQAGQYFVRPRYEVINDKGYQCIAHVNVERMDLKPDPTPAKIQDQIGKGYILPAPILPQSQYKTIALPTPMVRGIEYTPLKALFYTKGGQLQGEHKFGNLPRHHQAELILDQSVDFDGDYGHVELVYDFDAGDLVDTWLHGLFRYEDKENGHQAETSFGSHIFNNLTTYKNEPQSYRGAPPGLSTGLFLRVSPEHETFCQLMYPVSKEWHATSTTNLYLMDANGQQVAETQLKIPANGSRLWWVHEEFNADDIAKAKGGYVYINDRTCRLFGYHGVRNPGKGFAMDHMFGF